MDEFYAVMNVIDKLQTLPCETTLDLSLLSRRQKIDLKRRLLEARRSLSLKDVEVTNLRDQTSRKTSGYYVDKVLSDERLAGFRQEEKELLASLRVDPADYVVFAQPAQVREVACRFQRREVNIRNLEQHLHAAATCTHKRAGSE